MMSNMRGRPHKSGGDTGGRIHVITGGRGRRALSILAAAAAVTLTACGGSNSDEAATAPTTVARAPATTTTVAPTTTAAPTTTTSTSTVAPTTTTTTSSTTTTTLAPPTTVASPELDQPIAPPTDEYAAEPVIELGRVLIPKIGVDMAMYEGIRLSTLDYGPGHWPGTAMPGEPGNVVVAGHRVSKHKVFRNVDQLVAGDEIFFVDGNGEHRYIVNRVEIVEPTAMWIVDPTDTPTATLFACHPPGSTKQRIVVFADLAA